MKNSETVADNKATIKSLSVIVPALNEEENLIPTLENLVKVLDETVDDYEIVVINDGSADRTGEYARKYAADNCRIEILWNVKNKGLGTCYKQGVAKAQKEFLVYIPADNTWPYDSLFNLFKGIGKADIVTSYAANPEVRNYSRRIVSRLYTMTLNLLFFQRMHYFNGLTIYPTNYIKSSRMESTGFGFQAELLLRAIYKEFSVIEMELPIDERAVGKSKAVNFRNIISVLCTIIGLFIQLRVLRFGKKEAVIAENRPITPPNS